MNSSEPKCTKTPGTIHPKSKFTPEEDYQLTLLVTRLGTSDWSVIASLMKGRNTRQCRERWTNYLNPNVKNGPWSKEEDRLLEAKVAELGPKWTQIATFFPSRTDINIKNRWVVKMRQFKKNKMVPIVNRELEDAFVYSTEKQPDFFMDVGSISIFPDELCLFQL